MSEQARRRLDVGFLVSVLLLAAVWTGLVPTPARASDIQPRVVFHAFDIPVTSLADVCSSALVPSVAGVAYRITLIPDGTDTDLRLAVTIGAKTMTGEFNSGTSLTAGNLYTFTTGAVKGSSATIGPYSYNLRCGSSTRLAFILIEEIQGGEL